MNISQHKVHLEDRRSWYLGLGVLGAALAINLGFVFVPRLEPAVFREHPVLVFTQWWEEEMERGSLRALADEFEKRNPGVTIILDTRPYGEIRDRLVYSREGVKFPDIIGLDPRWIDEFIQKKLLEPLDAYRTEPEEERFPDAGRFVSPPSAAAQDWTLPLIATMNLLFYHIDMLQEAGFDRPPKNQDEFIRIAQAVTDPVRGRYALSIALSPENPQDIYDEFLPWFWAAGVPLIQDGRVRFDTLQGNLTLTFLSALYQEQFIAPQPFAKTRREKREEFITGRAAMMLGSVSDIHVLRERGVSFGITAVPGPASYIGKPVFGLQSWHGGIGSASRHKAEAWTFLQFLAENRSRLGAAAYAVPGGRTVEPYISEDPLYSKVYDIYEAGEALEEFAGLEGVSQMEEIFHEALYRMFEEKLSPAETAAALQQRLDQR
ncbi:MAG: extracellular solute-binding protein [Treponema sp.]|nr:extracellular solute-binding protein [Treponema sp.]